MSDFLYNLGRFRPFAVIVAVVGIIVIAFGIAEEVEKNAPREHLFSLSERELEIDEYLDCNVDFVVANYAETTKEDQINGITFFERNYSEHYIIPCYTADGELFFISAEVTDASYQERFDRILELSYSDNEADFQSESVDFLGRIKELDSKLVGYAYLTMSLGMFSDSFNLTSEAFNEMFLPYEIVVTPPTVFGISNTLAIGIVVLIIGVGLFFADIKLAKRNAAIAEIKRKEYIEAQAARLASYEEDTEE
jgi:hypothetical protein